MKRNSTTLFLESPNAITPVPWVNGAPDFSGFTPPTLWSLQKAWAERDGEPEVIPDPGPGPEPVVPNWDGFNAAMLGNVAFNQAYGVVLTTAPAVAAALPAALSQVSSNGVTAFGLVFGAFCAAGSVSVGTRDGWADLAETFDLPAEFVTVVRGS